MADSEKKMTEEEDGWRRRRETPSLPESFQTIPVPSHWPWWRKMLAFAGRDILLMLNRFF